MSDPNRQIKDTEATVVSLESHRRKRIADSRKAAAAVKARATPHERAINWRRTPFLLAALAIFMLFSWLIHYFGGLAQLFH